ncbi:isoprenylcysteine carboxylmethyltransferase family protein [candidate division WOR-3 bacterium]|nr:isoprenylcysteine carboxylmethyltransferase family protein [candidate division WOR-3 bacterium]
MTEPRLDHADSTNDRPGAHGSVTRWVVRELSGTAMAGLILFVVSRRWDWTAAWALVGIYAATFLAQAVVLIPRSPELLAERSARLRPGTKSWDRKLLPFYGISTLALLVVAGLDLRLGWSHPLPASVQYLGLGLALLGNGLVTWAMAANAFFAFSVRIQKERGQKVATTGPYRVVRHPGYVGAILFTLGITFLLGSIWALLPAAAAVLLLVVRTALEDLALKKELPGYVEYSGKTRFRLVPGVW